MKTLGKILCAIGLHKEKAYKTMKTPGEIKRLIRIAELAEDEESRRAMIELRKINPTYHWCNEWDGMVICDKDTAWRVCLCKIKDVTV